MNKKKYCMILEYDGADFHGWQRQPNHITIQEVIENKLEQILQQPVRIHGACRTDAGVHALSQAAHFTIPDLEKPIFSLIRGLNALLPKSISVINIKLVPDNFHARYSAIGKKYCYRLWNNRIEHPLLRRYCFAIGYKLDLDVMRNALKQIEGTHDFSAFRASSCPAKTTIRTIHKVHLHHHQSMLTFTFEGNGFLQHMIRILMGTVIEIGRGKRPLSSLISLLEAGERTKAGFTAPAHGLCLELIRFKDMEFPDIPRQAGIFDL